MFLWAEFEEWVEWVIIQKKQRGIKDELELNGSSDNYCEMCWICGKNFPVVSEPFITLDFGITE